MVIFVYHLKTTTMKKIIEKIEFLIQAANPYTVIFIAIALGIIVGEIIKMLL